MERDKIPYEKGQEAFRLVIHAYSKFYKNEPEQLKKVKRLARSKENPFYQKLATDTIIFLGKRGFGYSRLWEFFHLKDINKRGFKEERLEHIYSLIAFYEDKIYSPNLELYELINNEIQTRKIIVEHKTEEDETFKPRWSYKIGFAALFLLLLIFAVIKLNNRKNNAKDRIQEISQFDSDPSHENVGFAYFETGGKILNKISPDINDKFELQDFKVTVHFKNLKPELVNGMKTKISFKNLGTTSNSFIVATIYSNITGYTIKDSVEVSNLPNNWSLEILDAVMLRRIDGRFQSSMALFHRLDTWQLTEKGIHIGHIEKDKNSLNTKMEVTFRIRNNSTNDYITPKKPHFASNPTGKNIGFTYFVESNKSPKVLHSEISTTKDEQIFKVAIHFKNNSSEHMYGVKAKVSFEDSGTSSSTKIIGFLTARKLSPNQNIIFIEGLPNAWSLKLLTVENFGFEDCNQQKVYYDLSRRLKAIRLYGLNQGTLPGKNSAKSYYEQCGEGYLLLTFKLINEQISS